MAKVLYIDDEINNLELFNVSFNDEFSVFTCLNTQEARSLMKEHEFEVVVSDLKMPGENGLDFIKKESEIYPNTFYCILTAYADMDVVLKAFNLTKTFRFFLKPWDTMLLREAFRGAVNSYNLKKQNLALLSELKEKNLELEDINKQLQLREKQFKQVFECSSDAIVMFEQSGDILLANPSFYSYIDSSTAEISNFKDIFDKKYFQLIEEAIGDLMKTGTKKGEYCFDLDDQTSKYFETNSTLIHLDNKTVILSVIRDITDRKTLTQQIFNAALHSEENERTRLAAELHDGLGPILSTMKMYVEWMLDKNRKDNTENLLKTTSVSINEAITQVRDISHELSPHILKKFGLVAGIQSFIDRLKNNSKIEFTLNSTLKKRLKPNLEYTLYRTINECINNTIRHSQAKNSYITLGLTKDKFKLVYSDDGIGFDADNVMQESKGLGLYNIRNRIESCGGKIEIVSAPNMGVRIKIEFATSKILVNEQ